MARAFGSYPTGRWFKSNFRYQYPKIPKITAAIKRPVGQEAKTPPFHGSNTSSILVRVTTYISSLRYKIFNEIL